MNSSGPSSGSSGGSGTSSDGLASEGPNALLAPPRALVALTSLHQPYWRWSLASASIFAVLSPLRCEFDFLALRIGVATEQLSFKAFALSG